MYVDYASITIVSCSSMLIGCNIQGPSMIYPLHLGSLKHALYFAADMYKNTVTYIHSDKHMVNSVLSSRVDEAKLFHLRMGHVPFDHSKYVKPNIDIQGFSEYVCSICHVARQHRLSFSHSSVKTSVIFELLYVDVLGIFRVPTHDNCRYFLTIIDDFSRITWIHLSTKTESVSILKNFFALYRTQFHTLVKIIRTDNAKEFCERLVSSIYIKNGIIHHTSCSNTPQHNDVVVRKHKHLLETSRALYLRSK